MLDEYIHLLSDPAHMLVELTFMLVVDMFFLGFVWPLIKRAIRNEHKVIDAEHGVEHPE